MGSFGKAIPRISGTTDALSMTLFRYQMWLAEKKHWNKTSLTRVVPWYLCHISVHTEPSQPSDALPKPTDQICQYQPMNTTDDEEKTITALSHETRLKIAELKRLIYKYPQYHRNPGAVINCIIAVMVTTRSLTKSWNNFARLIALWDILVCKNPPYTLVLILAYI